jgi:hypothetical protein
MEPSSVVKYRGMVVPYITAWSSERGIPSMVITRPWSSIGYLDETAEDRDERGVLWRRVRSNPGLGRPRFGDIHTPRQRHAMRHLLCQVCAGPADRTEAGVLWLLKDHRGDWPGWPNGMGVSEPPVCLSCAQLARDSCPALRRTGHVAIRVARCPVDGVYGVLYRPGRVYPTTISTGQQIVIPFDDPAVRWVLAVNLVRELTGCTIIDLDTELTDAQAAYDGQRIVMTTESSSACHE